MVFLILSVSSWRAKINMKFSFSSLKTLIDYKNCSGFPLLSLLDFFLCTYIHSRLSEQFSRSQAGYGTTFRDTGSYQKAWTSSLKRVTRRNFTISKWFHRSKQKLLFGFPTQKSTKIFISWHYPFKELLSEDVERVCVGEINQWQRRKLCGTREGFFSLVIASNLTNFVKHLVRLSPKRREKAFLMSSYLAPTLSPQLYISTHS